MENEFLLWLKITKIVKEEVKIEIHWNEDKMSKEKIIMSTLELASKQGLRGISMSQIAEKAGLKKSSLYSHFSSKEEIISEMYTFLRKQANQNREIGQFDYGSFVEGKTLKEILMGTVQNYNKMNQNPQMQMFYKIIISEKTGKRKTSKVIRLNILILKLIKRFLLSIKSLFRTDLRSSML